MKAEKTKASRTFSAGGSFVVVKDATDFFSTSTETIAAEKKKKEITEKENRGYKMDNYDT
jgi:hypothetical protein